MSLKDFKKKLFNEAFGKINVFERYLNNNYFFSNMVGTCTTGGGQLLERRFLKKPLFLPYMSLVENKLGHFGNLENNI